MVSAFGSKGHLIALSGSGDQSVSPKLRKQVEEGVIGRLIAGKAKATALRHIGHDLDRPSEISIRVPRRCKTTKVRLDQALPLGNPTPDGSILLHLLFQRQNGAVEGGGLEVEPLCNAAPHPAPAKNIAVDHVERLIEGGRGGRSPKEMSGELPGIGHVGQAVPLCRRAW